VDDAVMIDTAGKLSENWKKH